MPLDDDADDEAIAAWACACALACASSASLPSLAPRSARLSRVSVRAALPLPTPMLNRLRWPVWVPSRAASSAALAPAVASRPLGSGGVSTGARSE